MPLSPKQVDLLSLTQSFGARTAQLSGDTMNIIRLAVARGMVTWNEETDEIVPLITTEDIQSASPALGDMTTEDLTYMFMLMIGTYKSADQLVFPDGRSASEIILKWAGNDIFTSRR